MNNRILVILLLKDGLSLYRTIKEITVVTIYNWKK